MRRLSSVLMSSVVLAGAGLTITATPAVAAYTTTISPLTITAGHVAGTITTDAPYVVVSVREPGTITPVDSMTVATHPGGEVAFNLETWGIATGNVTVKGCDPTATACEAVVSDTFTAVGVDPEVFWPTDSTIGQGQSYAITVSDPSGGGLIKAHWSKNERSVRTDLAREGTTTLPLVGDGAGTVSIWRCATNVPSRCRATGVSTNIVVDRYFATAGLMVNANEPINPALAGPVRVDWGVVTGAYDNSQPEGTAPVSLEWSVLDATDNSVVPGFGGVIEGLTPNPSSVNMRVSHDLAAIPDGKYKIRGVLTKDTADFGRLVATPRNVPGIVIDRAAPVTEAISRSAPAVYPAYDNYFDTVNVHVRRGDEKPATMRVDVINSSGMVVRKLTPTDGAYSGAARFTWNGKSNSGALVPAGTYVMRSVLTDEAGNVSAPKSVFVNVVRKKLSAREFRKTVTASGSEVDRYVGRCASIKSPASRGWYGSLGLYSNTKCSSDWDASLATTTHAIKVPASPRYGNYQILTYGGSATSAPGSVLGFGYINRDGDLKEQRFVGGTVATHAGALTKGTTYVFDDRYVAWSVWTGNGHRYDVRNFTVKLTYFVLVSDS